MLAARHQAQPPSLSAVLADNAGVGFDGKPVAYAGAKGDPLDVSAAVPPSMLCRAVCTAMQYGVAAVRIHMAHHLPCHSRYCAAPCQCNIAKPTLLQS